jgi:tight adherence protein B
MSALSLSAWLPWMLLVFIAVSLLLHGAWLIWDGTMRSRRRMSLRWARFHEPSAARMRSGSGRAFAGDLPGERLAGADVRTGGRRLLRWLDQPLRDAQLRWRTPQVLLAWSVIGLPVAGVGLVPGVPVVLVLPVLGLMLAVPWLYAARVIRRRAAQIQSQLADAVDLVARALRAGHALAAALRMVADQAPAPISVEFATVCDQIGFGVPADQALREMAVRSRSDDLRYVVTAVLLQRETGGNLAELLDNIAGLVRQRQQLRHSVRALSAEGRLSAWILGILPFALAGVISVINPDLLSLLWTDPAGRAMAGGAIFMMMLGILIMRQLVQVRA